MLQEICALQTALRVSRDIFVATPSRTEFEYHVNNASAYPKTAHKQLLLIRKPWA